MDSSTSAAFIQSLESLTKEDYATTLKTLGRKFLFARDFDFTDEAARIAEAYPAFDAAIQCHAPDPNQDLDEEMTRSFSGMELSAVFLATLLGNRPEGESLKQYLLDIKPAKLEDAAKHLFSVPLDVLTEKTRDWPSRFPAFAAFLADLLAFEDDGLLLHGACLLLIAVIDVAAQPVS